MSDRFDSGTDRAYRRRSTDPLVGNAVPVRPRLRELRLARGWSQVELSERAGVSVRSLARYESGAGLAARNVAALLRVAAALSMPVESVFPEVFGRRVSSRRSA